MNNNQSPERGFLPWHLSWLTVILGIITIGTFLAISGPGVQYAYPMMGGGTVGYEKNTVSAPSAPSVQDVSVTGMMRPDYYPYPYPGTDVPVTDTREFLKIYYNASMQTRDVPALTRRVETTVRGHDGRIDNQSSAEKYGYVSFVIPQTNYEAFRDELESLVNNRFIKVNISSQNLLSQKVSIEEQQKQADTTLAGYKSARQKLVTAHSNVVNILKGKIDAPGVTANEIALYQQQLLNEDASYAKQLSNADANIKYAQDWVKGVQTQDAKLLANVATVTGSVSIAWISLWDIARLYLPGYWIPAIFAVLTAISYKRDRRRNF